VIHFSGGQLCMHGPGMFLLSTTRASQHVMLLRTLLSKPMLPKLHRRQIDQSPQFPLHGCTSACALRFCIILRHCIHSAVHGRPQSNHEHKSKSIGPWPTCAARTPIRPLRKPKVGSAWITAVTPLTSIPAAMALCRMCMRRCVCLGVVVAEVAVEGSKKPSWVLYQHLWWRSWP
jgi:hypothetical protein